MRVPPDEELCEHRRASVRSLGWYYFLARFPCHECEIEVHRAWEQEVRGKLVAGLAAAAAGEPFDWDAPEGDGPQFALVRLDERIDLALSVGDDGRCTIPVAGRWSFPRVATLKDAINAERAEQVARRLREGTMTLNQARGAYAGEDPPLFPSAMGSFLYGILHPEPQSGPPWVHTVEPPRCDLGDCCATDDPCQCACHRVQPTHTITFDEAASADG